MATDQTSRPSRISLRTKGKHKKKKGNGIHAQDRGHGNPRSFGTNGSLANGFSDERSRAIQEAKERRVRAERIRDATSGSGNPQFLTQEDRVMLSELTRAMQENTDTLRAVHKLPAVVRTPVQAASTSPSEEDSEADDDADAVSENE